MSSYVKQLRLLCIEKGGILQTTTVTMATLIGNVGEVFTAAIGWVGDVAETITTEPVLLLACVAIPLCGLGIGMFKRLLSTRA